MNDIADLILAVSSCLDRIRAFSESRKVKTRPRVFLLPIVRVRQHAASLRRVSLRLQT